MPHIQCTPYIAPAVVSMDPYFSNVSLLMHMEGLNGQTTTTDNSGNAKTLTMSAGAKLSTAQAKFGSSSALFDGTTSALIGVSASPDFTFGTGDFTVEGWVYLLAFNGIANGIYQQGVASPESTTANTSALGTYNNSGWQIYANGVETNSPVATPALNVWHHFAVSRVSGVTKVFIDGVLQITVTDPTNYTGTNFSLGAIYQSQYSMNGYLDEVRVTKGVGRYSAAFTPPTTQFPDTGNDQYFANVVTLMHMEGAQGAATFNDTATGKAYTATAGTPILSTANKKFGSSSMLNSTAGAAGSITAPLQSADFDIGAGNFTAEMWFNPVSFPPANNNFDLFTFQGPSNLFNPTMFLWGDGTLYLRTAQAGGNIFANTAHNMVAGTWYHIALVRNGNVYSVYINGVLLASGTSTGVIDEVKSLRIGGGAGSAYFDEIRITKGIARYTGPFTPPTTQFLDQ